MLGALKKQRDSAMRGETMSQAATTVDQMFWIIAHIDSVEVRGKTQQAFKVDSFMQDCSYSDVIEQADALNEQNPDTTYFILEKTDSINNFEIGDDDGDFDPADDFAGSDVDEASRLLENGHGEIYG